MTSLELGLVGNGTVGFLVDAAGEVVWGCLPRFDGDPAFCALLALRGPANRGTGFWSIELDGQQRVEQEYLRNTPVLLTRLFDGAGGAVEVCDFAPRVRQHGRMYCPAMLVRRITRVAGYPRLRTRLRPAREYGREPAAVTRGANHLSFTADTYGCRLTTDAPLAAIADESHFLVDGEVTMVFGPDETVEDAPHELGRRLLDGTTMWWTEWVRQLAIPFEWQDAVIRAAITLELNVCEDGGAVIAAMTTSIPEASGTSRTWDYRFCWLRDAYFVVNALNRLGATRTMERYLGFVLNRIADASGGPLRPMYGIAASSAVDEEIAPALAGYRGMGPVRRGNAAAFQVQHDVYGSAILAAAHAFFDRRLDRQGDALLFHQIEVLGTEAARLFDQPDAGIWEFRGKPGVHTFSALMCWAGCDRLARIAAHLGLSARATHWRTHADRIHSTISARAWNAEIGAFTATFDGDTLDASLLRLCEVGFLTADDPRFAATITAIERKLRRGPFVFRYVDADDFGIPDNAFVACTFWYINALAEIGRRDEAREIFEVMLASRTRHGLLAEHVDPQTREPWGNFPQTYSMVGLIASAIRLSVRWDQAF
ncbi:MAG: glycoside hydrolase family 15 protein [Gemmatimonadota bacterium]|nr:glycoside hydrolase family 15 protein [Gemmatimonadota bacterium]